uniref:Uncharacterized protein n=1 Tax=Arundo donax TaxID=35708 RepID=A0A0A9AIL1_ARUDO
MALNALKKL